jgi:pentapeptide MXKDX repeat protein
LVSVFSEKIGVGSVGTHVGKPTYRDGINPKELPMKKILIVTTALTLMCGSAFAQTSTGPGAQGSDNMTKPNNETMEKGSMEKGSMNKETTGMNGGMKKDGMSESGMKKDMSKEGGQGTTDKKKM